MLSRSIPRCRFVDPIDLSNDFLPVMLTATSINVYGTLTSPIKTRHEPMYTRVESDIHVGYYVIKIIRIGPQHHTLREDLIVVKIIL